MNARGGGLKRGLLCGVAIALVVAGVAWIRGMSRGAGSTGEVAAAVAPAAPSVAPAPTPGPAAEKRSLSPRSLPRPTAPVERAPAPERAEPPPGTAAAAKPESGPEAHVTGRVVSAEDGSPIPGAEVATVSHGFLSRSRGETVRTGEDGRFSLDVAGNGRRQVLVTAPGYGPRVVKPTFEGAGATDLGDIALDLPAAVAGVVLDSTGAPVAAVKVEATSGMFGIQHAGAVADERGRFLLRDLPPGVIWLGADDEEAIEVGVSVELAAGELRHVVIGGRPQVVGRFVGNEDQDVVALRLDGVDPLVPIDGLRGLTIVEGRPEGGFAIGGLEPGLYWIGQQDAHAEVRVPPRGEPPVEVVIEPCFMAARVFPRATAVAPDRCSVLVVPDGAVERALAGDVRAQLALVVAASHSPQEDGAFLTRVPGPGRYQLFVRANGVGTARPVAAVAAGPTPPPPVLVEPVPCTEVTVRVAGAEDDEPILGVALDERGAAVAFAIDEDPDLWLVAGRYRIVALRLGGRRLESEVEVSGTGEVLVVLGEEAAD